MHEEIDSQTLMIKHINMSAMTILVVLAFFVTLAASIPVVLLIEIPLIYIEKLAFGKLLCNRMQKK